MASAAAKPTKPVKKVSSDSFGLSTEKWEDSFRRNLVRQALKKGTFVSICYPYKFAYCLVKFGYVPKSIASYSTVKNQRMLRVPSVKEYMDFMKDNEGDKLWMRGEITFCSTYVLYDLVEAVVREYVKKKSKSEKSLLEEYKESLCVFSVSVFVAVLVTQPFVVYSYRQIGQYVGKEELYSSASELINVFEKPGILNFIEGTLARYVYTVIPTFCGNIAARTWRRWLGTNYEWVRPSMEWCIDVSVYYWVAVAMSPLEIALISSYVWNSGITVGSEAFLPQGNFMKRFVSMWKDGRLSRSSSYYYSWLTRDIGAYVVL